MNLVYYNIEEKQTKRRVYYFTSNCEYDCEESLMHIADSSQLHISIKLKQDNTWHLETRKLVHFPGIHSLLNRQVMIWKGIMITDDITSFVIHKSISQNNNLVVGTVRFL